MDFKTELEEYQHQMNRLDAEAAELRKKYNKISESMEEKSNQIRLLKRDMRLHELSKDDIPELERELNEYEVEERLFWAYDPPYDARLPENIEHNLDDLRYIIRALKSM